MEGEERVTVGGREGRRHNKLHKSNFFQNGAWSMDYMMWLSALALARERSQWLTKSLYDLMFYSIYHFKFLQGSLQFQDDSCNWTLRCRIQLQQDTVSPYGVQVVPRALKLEICIPTDWFCCIIMVIIWLFVFFFFLFKSFICTATIQSSVSFY